MATEVERPYTIQEVCELSGLSPCIITKLFEREPGVVILKGEARRAIRIRRRVHESVMRRHIMR